MASLKLKALSPWKKIAVDPNDCNQLELAGFNGMEVLEDYHYCDVDSSSSYTEVLIILNNN